MKSVAKTKKRKMAKAASKHKPSRQEPCLGFRWTVIDEIKMQIAKWQAVKFMRHYGKGRKPVDCAFNIPLKKGNEPHKSPCEDYTL